MAIAPETLKKLIEDAIATGDGRIVVIDSNGNVVSDTPLSKIYDDLEALKGALQSVNTDKILMVLSEDDVGIAKDATLSKLTNALLSVDTDKLVVDIGEDGVGLAKDATLQDVKNELSQNILVNQALSYSNTGTATANYTVLSTDLSIDFNGTITIQILLNISTTAQLKLTPSGSTVSYTGDLNGGSALAANTWYEFEFNVDSGDVINFIIQVPAGNSLTGLLRVFKRER